MVSIFAMQLAAKCFFYFARAHELNGTANAIRAFGGTFHPLTVAYILLSATCTGPCARHVSARTSQLRSASDMRCDVYRCHLRQAVLINALLRNYLQENLIEQVRLSFRISSS